MLVLDQSRHLVERFDKLRRGKRYSMSAASSGSTHRSKPEMRTLMTTNRCETCRRLIARSQGTAPVWDAIYRTNFWDVVHSYNTSLPGWLVLIAHRHIEALADLTPPEALELGLLIQRVSYALQAVTGCVKTYVIQFAEAAEHPHVHFHIVPRMREQPHERRGPHIFGYLGVAEHERVDEATMNELAYRVQERLRADKTNVEN